MLKETLYELSQELALINDEIANKEGVLDTSLEARLDTITLNFDSKISNISYWILDLFGRETALDMEINRLTAKKKANKNLQNRLQQYIKESMEKANKKKLEFDTFTVALCLNPPSVEIMDEKAIPSRFLTIIPEQKIADKKAILEALKKGEKVNGAVLNDTKTHLRLR